jgi:hypothetical protein
MLNGVKNLFIDKLLRHILDGNKGSNLLTVILVPLLASNVNWMAAQQGLQFKDAASVTELAKVIGIVVVALLGYFVGKFPKLAKWAGFAEQVVSEAEKEQAR